MAAPKHAQKNVSRWMTVLKGLLSLGVVGIVLTILLNYFGVPLLGYLFPITPKVEVSLDLLGNALYNVGEKGGSFYDAKPAVLLDKTGLMRIYLHNLNEGALLVNTVSAQVIDYKKSEDLVAYERGGSGSDNTPTYYAVTIEGRTDKFNCTLLNLSPTQRAGWSGVEIFKHLDALISTQYQKVPGKDSDYIELFFRGLDTGYYEVTINVEYMVNGRSGEASSNVCSFYIVDESEDAYFSENFIRFSSIVDS